MILLTAATLWAQTAVPTDISGTTSNIKIPLVIAAPAPSPMATEVAPLAQKSEREKILEEQLSQTQAELKEKDALVSKLSEHLGSALSRLNRVQSPLSASNTSLAAMGAAKAKLEQQNNVLKAKIEKMEARMSEISKQKQLFDLENRQLFEALNGRPYREDVSGSSARPAKNDRGSRDDKSLLGDL